MTLHRNHNFSRQDPDCSDGDVFEDCNLAQEVPGTKICQGTKRLVFRGCNLVRAIVPPDSIIEGCNTTQAPAPPEIEPEEEITIPLSEYERLKAIEAAQELADG